MIFKDLKVQKLLFIMCVLQAFALNTSAQLKDYKLSDNGDTLNAVDSKGMKQGKWIIKVDEIRGEPGYEEEGVFKNDKKDGVWRRYNMNSDLIGLENYRFGGKDGVQQYYTMIGDLVREESWRAYNPDAPYDTIPVYGPANDIISYKVVKAQQYSVKDGEWKFYEPGTGRLIKSETYDRGYLLKDPNKTAVADDAAPKKKVKPAEVLEYEKKNSGKKKVKVREGQTGL